MPVITLPLERALTETHGAKPGDDITVEVWRDGEESSAQTLTAIVRDDEHVDVDIPVEFSEETLNGRVVGIHAPKPSSRPAAKIAETDIDDLYSYIAGQGIDLPREIVSRYLLSLQTKPFVILTGISGTGKTKIAQLVAEYYTRGEGDRVETLELPEDTAESFYAVVNKSSLVHGISSVKIRQIRQYFEMPERGTSCSIPIDLPDELGGGTSSWRLQNIAFSDAQRQQFQFTMPTDVRRALVDTGIEIGDQLRFDVVSEGSHFRVTPIRRQRVSGDGLPDRSRFAFVPVRPDWTDSRALLGYFNPLLGQYSRTKVLDLMMRAGKECSDATLERRPPRPYFLLLDEMNLAKVEHYFAEFLSLLESRKVRNGKIVQEDIPLHDEDALEPWIDEQGAEWTVPQSIAIPPNLLITGTVNVDETTYMFSPKVLDRANVIEFQDVDVRGYLSGAAASRDEQDALVIPTEATMNLELGGLELPGRLHFNALGPAAEDLAQLNDLLARHNRHFGYRVINEIAAYLHHTDKVIGGAVAARASRDVQILQKVLPKLHGTHAALDGLLRELLAFTLTDNAPSPGALPSTSVMLAGIDVTVRQVTFERAKALGSIDLLDSADVGPMTPARYPRSARKLHEMLRVLAEQGFVAFVQ